MLSRPIAGDRIQLQQVILNLLRNASDAMVGVHERPRQLLIRTVREDGDRVRLRVRDTGLAFDRQSLDELFDAFYTTKAGVWISTGVRIKPLSLSLSLSLSRPDRARWRGHFPGTRSV
jgi:C4-dicarboxylate-specific signal transduction histidine kinase